MPTTAPTAHDLVHDLVRERLDAVGQRYTRGRRAIVDTLVAADGPLTLPGLLASAPSMPQSSAYRNLAAMEEAGVVRRLIHNDGHAHYELAEELTQHHHHMICATCGSITDVTLDPRTERSLMAALDKVAAGAGFAIDRHQLDAFGRCARCQG